MKSLYGGKGGFVFFAILLLIGNATSQSLGDETKRVIADLKFGNWIKKGESAEKIAEMTGIPIEERLQLLFEVLEEECRVKTSDKKPEGSYKTISVYLKDQYTYAIAVAGIEDPTLILRHLDKAEGEFKNRLTLSLGLLKIKDNAITSGIIQLAKSSQDGYIRTMAIRVLSEWKDKKLIPIFNEGLNDNFKIKIKTDLINTNTVKGKDGYYYKEYYPVRNEAATALKKLGINVKRNKNDFWVENL